jgi:hypothetical protein
MGNQEGQRQITITVPAALSDLFECYRQSEMARHVRGVRREMLMTLRSLIDARIESLREEDEAEEKSEPLRSDAKRVDVK